MQVIHPIVFMNGISDDAQHNQQALHTEASNSQLEGDAAKGKEAEETLRLSADASVSVTETTSNAQNLEAASNEDDCEQPVQSNMLKWGWKTAMVQTSIDIKVWARHDRKNNIIGACPIKTQGMANPVGEKWGGAVLWD
jgi:hypothetical protein